MLQGNAYVDTTRLSVEFDGAFGTYADLGTQYLGGAFPSSPANAYLYTQISTSSWLRADVLNTYICLGCPGASCSAPNDYYSATCFSSYPWIMNAPLQPTGTVCSNSDPGTVYQLINGNNLGMAEFEPAWEQSATANGPGPIPGPFSCLGCWVHVATVVDYDGNGKLYVNGTLAATVSTPPQANVSRSVWLGRGPVCGDSTWQGGIADFQVYSRVLSAYEVAALYAGIPPLVQDGSFEMAVTGNGITLQNGGLVAGNVVVNPYSSWAGWQNLQLHGYVFPIFNDGAFSEFGVSPVDGSAYAALQGAPCALTQIVEGLTPSSWYSITFWYNARSGGYDGNDLNLAVNGAVVFNVPHVYCCSWTQATISWQAGASVSQANVTFFTTIPVTSHDGMTFLDDVRMVAVPAPPPSPPPSRRQPLRTSRPSLSTTAAAAAPAACFCPSTAPRSTGSTRTASRSICRATSGTRAPTDRSCTFRCHRAASRRPWTWRSRPLLVAHTKALPG